MPCNDGTLGLITAPSGNAVDAACPHASADPRGHAALDRGPGAQLEQSTGQRSTAQEYVSTPFTQPASSRCAPDLPLVVPPYVFSLAFGDAALMDPPGLQTALDDSRQSRPQPYCYHDSSGYSATNYNHGSNVKSAMSQCAGRYQFKGALNSEEQVDLSRFDFGDLGFADEPPTDLPGEQYPLDSNKQPLPRFSYWGVADQTGQQGASVDSPPLDQQPVSPSSSGIGGEYPTNKLGQGGTLDDSLYSGNQLAWPPSLDCFLEVPTDEDGSKDSRDEALNGMQQPCLVQSSSVTTHLSTEPQVVRQHTVADKTLAGTGSNGAGCNWNDLAVPPIHPPVSGTTGTDVPEQDERPGTSRDLVYSQKQQDCEASSWSLIPHQSNQDNAATGHVPSPPVSMLRSQDASKLADEASVARQSSVQCSGTESGGRMNQRKADTAEACPQRCIRVGCTFLAVQSYEWDGEYCSRECVVSHCNASFAAWVAARRGAGDAAE
ncbi:hypothetical protein V5799_032516 [Amblyomma americanum]|uniref:Uncharacterized protein n=1 Tax=Amblyomma americanum TaxID=6943 RepID=A0AAQ4DQY6_AMBAM